VTNKIDFFFCRTKKRAGLIVQKRGGVDVSFRRNLINARFLYILYIYIYIYIKASFNWIGEKENRGVILGTKSRTVLGCYYF